MPFSFYKSQKLRIVFLVYWVLLLYIIAALVWWFIALNRQNNQMTRFEIAQLDPSQPGYAESVRQFRLMEKRKTSQYIGEGAIFLILICAGAVYVFRSVRNQLKATLQQQNFMMAITHELKTPIAVTKLNLETLQKRKLDEAQQKRLIGNTLQEANRLNALCNNLLLSSQIDAGDYHFTTEELSLSEIAAGCIDEFISRFPERKFFKEIGPEIFVNGDRLMLQIVINNLIDNAIKYSPRDATISLLLQQQHNKVYLSVTDEGKGISDEEKAKVFDKYYRVGNAATKGARGTGLGLYLTKKIVLQHGGTISMTDHQPQGSNFTIIFNPAA